MKKKEKMKKNMSIQRQNLKKWIKKKVFLNGELKGKMKN